MSQVERKELADRQLDALLERLDNLAAEVARINRRLESNEGLALIASQLATLNESLQTLAYAALGRQGPDVRRRRAS
jgi:DNA-binding FrmR family transcriptional regulator